MFADRWRMSLCCALVLISCVEGLHVFAKGSKMHHDETSGSLPHEEKDPVWETVVRLRTPAAFYKSLGREPLALVFFYTRWSQPALLMAPELDRQAAIMWQERPGIPVFAVSLEDCPELGKEYRVNGVPNFAVFRFASLAVPNEQMVPRYMPAVAGYMRTLLKDAVPAITTLEAAMKIVDPKHQVPVGKAKPGLIPASMVHPDDEVEKSVFFCFTDDDAYTAAIHDASRMLSTFFAIYHLSHPKLHVAYRAEPDSCVLYRRWSGVRTPVSFSLTAAAARSSPTGLSGTILTWLIYNAIPPMAIFDEESKPLYSARHKPLLIYFSPGRLHSDEPLFKIMAEIGMDPTLNVTATQCDPNKSGKYIAHFLGMDGSLRYGGYAIGLLVGRKKYRFNQDIESPTDANLRNFIRQALDGTWPEFRKSEDRSHLHPKGSGRVADLAFTDFEEIVVNDQERDALILFYRPDDRHSVDVLPVLDQVADRLKAMDILVGRFNVMENDYHTSYIVPGTPTILYAQRTNKTFPVKLSGVARTVENLEAFVAEHATVSLGGFSPTNRTPSPPQPSPPIKQRGPRGGDRDEL